jgi:demethylmenaquinone methyltransferase/2-methoxy-6-polyprenyl-1,4-benzoquinol methylase
MFFKKNSNNPRFILLNKIPNNNSKILEIAVGTAENIILLAKNKSNVNIIGIDLSEEMLEIAKWKIKNENIQNIELLKMDAVNLLFGNGIFDYIIISLLLHEVPEEIGNKILKECLKKLKAEGKIYVLEWEEPKKIIQKITFLLIKIFEPKWYKQFMKKDLHEYFLKNGFKINTTEYGDYSKVIELVSSANCI